MQPVSLVFLIQEKRKGGRNQKFEINLKPYQIPDTSDMKEKVLHIIRDALEAEDIQGEISSRFATSVANYVLKAEAFSSDEFDKDCLLVKDSSEERLVSVGDIGSGRTSDDQRNLIKTTN